MAHGGYSSATGLADPPPSTFRCGLCGKQNAGQPSLMQSKLVCERCVTAASARRFMDAGALFKRGLVLGGIAAFLSLLLLACVELALDRELGPGFIAVAVGWVVGRAFAHGSKGERGTRFACAAAVLTYFAIALAPVPVVLTHVAQNPPADGNWTQYFLLRLPAWTLFSPFLIEKGRGLMGIVRICFFVGGLAVASRESGIARRAALR
jgi:hypothetical protein